MKACVLMFPVMLMACSPKEEVPADLLPREKFTDVLLEAELVEARLNMEQVLDHNPDRSGDAYYAEMFAREGVSEATFKATFEWYVAHPEELKSVYNDVLTGLQRRVDVADSTGTDH